MHRPDRLSRRTVMRTTTLVSLVLTGLLVAGCGRDAVDDEPSGRAPAVACPPVRDDGVVVLRADLDGDGVRDRVEYLPRTPLCGPLLAATVAGHETSSTLDDDVPIHADESFAISVPGRTGEIAVLRQVHPRGGFQVILLAWSGAGVSTLNVDGYPVFPFVATDVESTPLAARCVPGGFEITQARHHEPVGVAAWDVDRTRYTVNGTSTTAGPTTKVADNVLESDFHQKYTDLVDYSLFRNCLVAGK